MEDVTLYAKFVKIYKIDYVLDGGENPIDQYLEFTVLSIEDLLPATKYGYTFKGWYLDETFETEVVSLSDLEEQDTILYAYFEANIYEVVFTKTITVTYYSSGVIHFEQTGTYGDELIVPNNPSKQLHTFYGWKNRATGEMFDFSGYINTDLELDAVFKEFEQNLQNDLTINPEGTLIYTYESLYNGKFNIFLQFNSSLPLSLHVKEDDELYRVTIDYMSNLSFSFDVSAGKTYTLYLVSKETISDINIIFLVYPEIDEMVSTAKFGYTYELKEIAFGECITGDVLELENYTFNGWFDKKGKLYVDKNGNCVSELDVANTLILYPFVLPKN